MKHERGVVSTVSIPGKANSEGAQFFVCVSPQPALDGKFSAFGRVTEGIDVVEKISQVPADSNGITEKPVRILKVTIEKKREEPFRKRHRGGNAQDGDAEDDARQHQDQNGAGLGAGERAQLSEADAKRLVQRDSLPPHRERLCGAGRSAGRARLGTQSLRRPLGASGERRVPHRCEARARHHIHGAWGRPEFSHHFVLSDAGSGDRAWTASSAPSAASSKGWTCWTRSARKKSMARRLSAGWSLLKRHLTRRTKSRTREAGRPLRQAPVPAAIRPSSRHAIRPRSRRREIPARCSSFATRILVASPWQVQYRYTIRPSGGISSGC